MELISVIVPVYNVESYVAKCIESIQNQSYQHLEIILVDDGSTDDSGDICDQYAAYDDRIKVIHQENGGLSAARNTGIEAANGDYIGFVDSDDYIGLTVYEDMLHLLKENNLDDIAIQGEFCGPGIQKNRLNLKTPEWYVFTVIDMKTNTRLSMYKTEEICKLLGLNMVPVEEVEEEFKYKSVDELLERAKGKYASGKNKEGIVIRPIETVYSNTIAGPLSMKVLNNDYLLKE